MALSDGSRAYDVVTRSDPRLDARVRFYASAVERDAARSSEERTWRDRDGSVWRYVVLDAEFVRILRCEPSASDVGSMKLSVPADIEGLRVVALAPDALARLAGVEEIVCSDGIVSVGPCAFRQCENLRSVALPDALDAFDADWFRGCGRLERLVLPGRLVCMRRNVLDLVSLRELVIGAGTREIEPGAFSKSSLDSIAVDGRNVFLSTDGTAVYSRDGARLVALAVPVGSYDIALGCRIVERKGMSQLSSLSAIGVPEGLEELAPFAFSGTSISAFVAPRSLRVVGEKAFYGCSSLAEVRLNDGLRFVGKQAFSDTALRKLRLPASVEDFGTPIAEGCGLSFSGPDASFSIDERSGFLALDDCGGLYRTGGGGVGMRFARLLDPHVARYEIQAGAVAVEPFSMAGHAAIEEVVIPEGVVEIGQAAFKTCRALRRVVLPSTLRSIGDEAFLDTALERLELPAALEHVGVNALVTEGAHRGKDPTLRSVAVDPSCERFLTVSGLLLERLGEGRMRVVLCMGDEAAVRIPSEVDEIAPYAFNGVTGIEELYLSDRITSVGPRGLAVGNRLELIHVDLMEPIEGHESFDLRFPDTDRSAQQMSIALSVPSFVDVARLFENYDNAIVNASSFDIERTARLDLYEQTRRIIDRLRDPVFLTSSNRSMCECVLTRGIGDICVAVAKHGDRATFDALIDLGYLSEINIDAAIDRVGALQDAAMTGYLLEAKRRRFGLDALDFEL